MKKNIPELELSELGVQKDDKAKDEAAAIDDGDLEKKAKVNEHKRKEAVLDHFNWAFRFVFRIIVWGFSLGIIILLFHMFMPKSWHFLDKDQIDIIKTSILSSFAFNLATNYCKKYL